MITVNVSVKIKMSNKFVKQTENKNMHSNTVYSCRSIYLILSVIQPSCFKVRSGHHKEIGLSFRYALTKC